MANSPDDREQVRKSHVDAPKAMHFCTVKSGPIAAMEALEAADFFLRAADALSYWPRLAIVVEEAVMNVVDHGAAAETAVILLGFALHDRGIRLTIEDQGEPWDPRGRAPSFDEERIGGAGLRLIEAWTTIEDYARVGDRNRLVLFLNR